MSMGSSEGFKNYAQKWRDIAGRVQPPLSDRELVDMFLGTLSGSLFNHLIESSSARFTELILTGEWVEANIKSGKIQRDVLYPKIFPLISKGIILDPQVCFHPISSLELQIF